MECHLQSCPGTHKPLPLGPAAKQGKVDKLLWADLEIRVQLCSAPPPPGVWRRPLSKEHSLLSPPQHIFVKFSPHWVMCHNLPTPKPASYTESLVFRSHLQISGVKRKCHYLALGPWTHHSLSLDLSVPSITWTVTVLPTNPLLILPDSTSKELRA